MREYPIVNLEKAVEFLDSKRRPVKASERKPGPYPYYGANGQQGTIDNYIFDEELVLLAEDGGHFFEPSRGIAYKIKGKSWVNNHAHVLKPKAEVNIDYLCLVLKHLNVTKFLTGTTRAKLTKAGASRIQIPLPPLAEQKRIAGILDAADRLRAQRREALAQLDTLLQSTFLDLFGDPVTNPMGWEWGVIGDMLQSATYGTSKKADPKNGNYPALRMNNITFSGNWDFSSLKFVTLTEKELSKHLVRRGQILFNRTNSKELVGKTAVYREDEPMAYAGYLVRGITNQMADPEYIGAFMNMPQTKQYLQNKCKNIVGMANINAKEFQAIPIQIPPLPLQKRFASIVESVEEQKARMRAHLAELDALFASLQDRAFRGEL
jgi:type I restriction enzyme S subunit